MNNTTESKAMNAFDALAQAQRQRNSYTDNSDVMKDAVENGVSMNLADAASLIPIGKGRGEFLELASGEVSLQTAEAIAALLNEFHPARHWSCVSFTPKEGFAGGVLLGVIGLEWNCFGATIVAAVGFDNASPVRDELSRLSQKASSKGTADLEPAEAA